MKRPNIKSQKDLDISGIRQQALEQIDHASEVFENTTSKIKGYVKTNPQKALMIAAGFGVAIGVIASSFLNGKAKR